MPGLDYDFLKTYVRLPASRMKMVIDEAHRLGVPSSSHYLSPGALVGQDGTTHLAATQRLGFARTLTATGDSYDDVPALYGAGNRTVTTTLFTSDFLTRTRSRETRGSRCCRRGSRTAARGRRRQHGRPRGPGLRQSMCKEVRTLLRIAAAGGEVLVGTDSPLEDVGISVHANLQELVGYGWGRTTPCVPRP